LTQSKVVMASTETNFVQAKRKTKQALMAAQELPPSQYLDWAKDNLQAGLGWLQQAYNEWLTEEGR
jgi:hypothetical protein